MRRERTRLGTLEGKFARVGPISEDWSRFDRRHLGGSRDLWRPESIGGRREPGRREMVGADPPALHRREAGGGDREPAVDPEDRLFTVFERRLGALGQRWRRVGGARVLELDDQRAVQRARDSAGGRIAGCRRRRVGRAAAGRRTSACPLRHKCAGGRRRVIGRACSGGGSRASGGVEQGERATRAEHTNSRSRARIRSRAGPRMQDACGRSTRARRARSSSPIRSKLPIIVDLAIPPADSAFPPGLYGINQTLLVCAGLGPLQGRTAAARDTARRTARRPRAPPRRRTARPRSC